MKLLSFSPWLVAAIIGGVFYPLLVYCGMSFFSPKLLVGIGVILICFRLWGTRQNPGARLWQGAFLVSACGLLALLFLNARLAVYAYPVLVSLSVAAIFGISLFFPPTMVERIARLTEPNLPPKGVIYTRKVTMVWVVFLVANAGVSVATALWGTLSQWTLWNGLLSYLVMGTLFVGEWTIRERMKR